MRYFAMIDGRQVGPLQLEQLADAGVTPFTYVWCKGMPDWVQAREVADICRYYRRRLFDRMHPAPLPVPVQASEPDDPEQQENYFRIRQAISSAPDHENTAEAPSAVPTVILLLAFISFFPLGILAILARNSSRRLWENNQAQEAHDAARRSKMLAGIAICFGVITLASMLY